MACLDADTIAALFTGDLSESQRADVDLHVDACASCRQAIAALARTRVASATPRTADTAVATEPETGTGSRRGHVSLAAGDSVGRYVVTGFLGAGAMGAVYSARDPQLDRAVALKIVGAGAGDARARRLVREAQAMARLSHPNVIPVYDAGHSGPLVFIAMKQVDGVSLRRHLDTPRPPRDVIRLMREAGAGIAAAHAAGIVHRDLKPDNILVERGGAAQVGDFGLAVIREDLAADGPDAEPDRPSASELRTADGTILGTPAYMAPEVRRGEPADARSDQYSFAITLAEAVTGSRPGGTATAELPRPIRRVVERATADDPGARFPTMTALLAALAPRRTTRAGAIVLAAVAIAAVAIVVWPRPPAEAEVAATCARSADARLAEAWNPTMRGALVDRIGALPRPGAPAVAASAVDRIDRYATAWLAMRREACLATRVRGEQTAALLDLKMACLDERLDALAAVRRSLDQVDATNLDGARMVADTLGDLDRCADTRGLLGRAGPDADSTERARALRARLSDASAIVPLGKFDDAERTADAVIGDAVAARLPAVEAEAHLVRSMARAYARRPGVVDGFHAALAIGDRLGDPRLRVEALIGLIADATADRARASEVALLVRMIESALAELPGPQPLHRGRLAGNLVHYYVDRGDLALATTKAEEAIAAFDSGLGPTHPFTLMARQNLAMVLSRQGNYDGAIDSHVKLVAAARAAYGDVHPYVVGMLSHLATAQAQAERRDEARATFAECVALAEQVYGPDHVELADALRMHGYFLLDEDPARAREVFARALAIYESISAPELELAPILVGLGQAELEVGDARVALRTLERGLAGWGDSQLNSHLLPSARYAVARALWKSGGDRKRARALAIQARDEFLANKGPWLPIAGQVSAWLEAHK